MARRAGRHRLPAGPGRHRVRPVLLADDDEYEPGRLVRETRELLASAEAETLLLHDPLRGMEMSQRLNPDKPYHQISVGRHRQLWREFISFCRYEASPLNEQISKAMAAYPPFEEFRQRSHQLRHRKA